VRLSFIPIIFLILSIFTPRSVLAQFDHQIVIVKSGDTLWNLANHYLNNPHLWPELMEYNGYIEDPDLIFPGQTIRIPIFSEETARKVLEELEYLEKEGSSDQREKYQAALNALNSGDYGMAPILAQKAVPEKSILSGSSSAVEHEDIDRIAQISATTGKVTVRRSGKLKWVPASPGYQLSSGDLIRTYTDATAELHFNDGNRLTMRPNALIEIGIGRTVGSSVSEKKVQRSSVTVYVNEVEALTASKEENGAGMSVITTAFSTNLEPNTKAHIAVSPPLSPKGTSNLTVYKGKAEVSAPHQKVTVHQQKAFSLGVGQGEVQIKNILPAPEPIDPKNDSYFYFRSLKNVKITFHWQPVNGAKYYQLELSPSSLFGFLVEEVTRIEDTEYTLTSLLNGSYFWRVIAISEDGIKGNPSQGRFLELIVGIPPSASEDKEPPFLDVDELKIDGTTILVTGRTEKNVSVFINKTRVYPETNGNFMLQVRNQKLGRHIINIKSIDLAGNINFVQKEVILTGNN